MKVKIKLRRTNQRQKPIDLNRIARDPIAWNEHAKQVMTKLSNLPNASKVPRSLFTSEELEKWL